MTRQTSIDAYHKVKESGLLSSLRLKVYKIVCEQGPLTAGEMRNYGGAGMNSGVYATRLSELQRLGAIKEIGKRPCRTTGFTAIVWDITGDLPVKPKKKLTRKEKKEIVMKKIVAHGKRDIPSTADDINTYKNELREIYVNIRDL